MKSLDTLVIDDSIAFEWKFGTLGPEIFVAKISSVEDDRVLVHFLYGYKSESEWVKKNEIIAIGDLLATGKIKGWTGHYNILIPDHKLLN